MQRCEEFESLVTGRPGDHVLDAVTSAPAKLDPTGYELHRDPGRVRPVGDEARDPGHRPRRREAFPTPGDLVSGFPAAQALRQRRRPARVAGFPDHGGVKR